VAALILNGEVHKSRIRHIEFETENRGVLREPSQRQRPPKRPLFP